MYNLSPWQALCNTLIIYIPSWVLGVLLGLIVSCISWFVGGNIARLLYLVIAGLSFVPVTIMIPYFLQAFGLDNFIFPLISFPVALVICASLQETIRHINRTRATLLGNYYMTKPFFIRYILLRESLTSIISHFRVTLALSFSIFIALDYFLESWNGLGSLIKYYYYRVDFNDKYYFYMFVCVLLAWLVGFLNVLILTVVSQKFVDFRKYY